MTDRRERNLIAEKRRRKARLGKEPPRPVKTVSAEQIARMAERGNDVSGFFTNTGKMMKTDSTGQCRFRIAETGLRQEKLKRD
jgi:hypothetical protein